MNNNKEVESTSENEDWGLVLRYLEKINNKFETMNEEIKSKFEKMNNRFEEQENIIIDNHKEIKEELNKLSNRCDRFIEKIDNFKMNNDG